ncbi:stem-specific protein TSJT1-like [Aristolochia californica]|uniref:stem-specific protein TSJT1-like n=1 Tax=Aristolochia californica TaxID=171875 RepID=UPI0035D5712E
MLAIFHKSLSHPPQELYSSSSASASPEEILQGFLASQPDDSFSATFGRGAAIAFARPLRHFSIHQRLYCGLDDINCLFYGSLNNLSTLLRQYGLSKSTNEAMLVIEAYRTLRDRGPYPADQVIKDLNGSFAFIVYDDKAQTVFVALSSDGGIALYWGMAADGSVVITDELDVIKKGCGKSFAPFPPGCMFHSEGGLKSFEHPMNRLKAMPRVDSDGVICGANFKVDKYSKINSMPRVGSQANWTSW